MADASIFMLLNRLAPMIGKKVREEVCLMLNANDEAEKLNSKLKKIQEVLMDAEQQGITDRKVKSWLDKLQDISYDIDEVLDQWDLEIQKRRLEELDDAASESSDSLLHKVSSFLQSLCLCFRESIERRTIAKDIKKLNERLDSIVQENENEFKFIPNLSRGSPDFKRNISTSSVEVSEVKGRDVDLILLKKKLLPESGSVEEDGIQIVSLVGLGGMGKTTLAQLAFDDKSVQDHFYLKRWVCVSDPFDEIKIAKEILREVNRDSPNRSDFETSLHSDFETLLQSIRPAVLRKRFLLVLDDVWTEDDTMWKPLKITLMKNGAPGSRILVTTRKMKVAEIMGSTQIQSLNPLSDSSCWSVLSQIAFSKKDEVDCQLLEEIGRKIASKCKGMPLAAKTLGTLLSSKSSPKEWEKVLNSKLWEMAEMRANFFPFLALSYNELHPKVKRCFSYCAIFPKGFLIYVDELIRIWMAQGFLNSRGTSSDMEQKGQKYFEDLAMRSFFQDFERDRVGGKHIIGCKMHDLVHDFTQFLTNNECLIAENNEICVTNVRHLNFLKYEAKTATDMFSHCHIEKLCSFMCKTKEIPHNLLKNLKRVKLLKLSGDFESKDIPEEIGNLIHLRFLDLSGNVRLEKLPVSICDLYYLQTLDLRWCCALSGLPHGIHKLVKLRHLLVSHVQRDVHRLGYWRDLLVYGCYRRFEFTQGLEKLVNLRRLDSFTCGEGSGNKLRYLKDLNLIRGHLQINIAYKYGGSDKVADAEDANLKTKEFIEHLTLNCHDSVGLEVIDALQPSPNLGGLHFINDYLPNWITTLIQLRELTIQGVGRMDVMYPLRNLPALEHLNLCRCYIEYLRLGFFGPSTEAATTKPPSAFPNLLTFRLVICKYLSEWEDIGVENENIISIFPRLRELRIHSCQGLRKLPHRLLRKASSLQILDIRGCEHLQERYDEGREDRDQIAQIPSVHICE